MPTSTRSSMCQACVHYVPPNPYGDKFQEDWCDAFPDGIPVAIRNGGDHRTPVDGDGGVVFDLEPGKEAFLQAWEIANAS